MEYIRNFCIIAHIDHGKSTLADRLLEYTNTVMDKDKRDQMLDDMPLERDRGITIKSKAIQMKHKYQEKTYILNLIDTPGHVDFSYEVSRSISACEGALLVVDATKGMQAQTISNLYLALENSLTIIPIINKIDLPNINIDKITNDIINIIGCNPNDIIYASAKKGYGIKNIIENIIKRIPNPSGDPNAPLQALIFDSIYNPFRGIEVFFRVKNGVICKGQKLKFMATNKISYAYEIGNFKLNYFPKEIIHTGDIGYVITGIKNTNEIKVGDTLTTFENPSLYSIKGFKEVKSMVFAGIYPENANEYEELRLSIDKLRLNDASITFTPEHSIALGMGFRCGFLGMLHMEIIQERLKREYGITVITTVPNVSYKVFFKKKNYILNSPSDLVKFPNWEKIEEPYIIASIITITDYIGQIISLCIEKRGNIKKQNYITNQKVELIFEMPLSEVIFDFYDKLKTISKGYASFDYTYLEHRISDLVKIDILINYQNIDAISALVHKNNAFKFGKKICEKLHNLIPRQQFDIPIQAAIGSKIISRETIKALRKDVTSKCYGGDISRKRKLLEKQKKGKKKMRKIGQVKIPKYTFMEVFKFKD
ncbi:MAG: translation elongation factor 4 [Candidatus Bostrichicola ureolyticus]|nr:MAG: translation elongation factor 4 [Candidatus Bostrichicola ureolyticus]